MKCMNCNAEISPQYVHAIANNICPGCGESIYDDQTKEIYNELKEAMLRMPNDPVGLAGWLLDNYKLYKIGSAEPVDKFYNKSTVEPKSKNDSSKIKTASSEKTNEFFQRAGVSPQTKSKLPRNYEVLVDQINSNVESDEMYGDDGVDEVEMVDERFTEDDFNAAREMNAQFDEKILIPGEPLRKNEMKELKALLSKPSGISENHLETERMQRLQRQESMLSGSGGFKR